MKLFYFYTDDEEYTKLKSLFENNLKDQSVTPFGFEYKKLNKRINRGGGYLGWDNRYKTILKGFEHTELNEYFLCSDIDIRFYKNINLEISDLINKHPHVQLWFQKEFYNHGINIGFMVIKNTPEVKQFFDKTNQLISRSIFTDKDNKVKIKHPRRKAEGYTGAGQDWVNDTIYYKSIPVKTLEGWYSNHFKIFWNRLPTSFWHPIFKNTSKENIVYHHATCEHNINRKIKQLKYES